MDVEYSGWNVERGFFSFQIPVDEHRKDYEIRMNNGSIYRQNTPFQTFTHDWNCDGDIYSSFGAFFNCDGRGEFFSVTDMVRLVVDGDAEIPGIENPLQHPPLDQQISRANSRSDTGSGPSTHRFEPHR